MSQTALTFALRSYVPSPKNEDHSHLDCIRLLRASGAAVSWDHISKASENRDAKLLDALTGVCIKGSPRTRKTFDTSDEE